MLNGYVIKRHHDIFADMLLEFNFFKYDADYNIIPLWNVYLIFVRL